MTQRTTTLHKHSSTLKFYLLLVLLPQLIWFLGNPKEITAVCESCSSFVSMNTEPRMSTAREQKKEHDLDDSNRRSLETSLKMNVKVEESGESVSLSSKPALAGEGVNFWSPKHSSKQGIKSSSDRSMNVEFVYFDLFHYGSSFQTSQSPPTYTNFSSLCTCSADLRPVASAMGQGQGQEQVEGEEWWLWRDGELSDKDGGW